MSAAALSTTTRSSGSWLSDDVAERWVAWGPKIIGAVADDVREPARPATRRAVPRLPGLVQLAVSTRRWTRPAVRDPGRGDQLTVDVFAAGRRRDARLAERLVRTVEELWPGHYEDLFFQEAPAAGGVDLTEVFDGTDVVDPRGRPSTGSASTRG